MRRATVILSTLILAVFAGGLVFAGNSGITDPEVTVTWKTNTDGRDRAAKELASLQSLETAVKALIDEADATAVETGTVTNGQTVVLSNTYTAAPLVIIEQSHATSNAYASTVTTTNFVAVVPGATTNTYLVIAVQ